MTKKEYLETLEKELQALPYDEQKEALEYYQNYFDDAGSENEESVMKELGTVEELGVYIRSNFPCVPAKITDKEQQGNWYEETYDYLSQQVKSLDINIAVAKLEICHGEKFTVRIENTHKNRIYSNLRSNGTLKIGAKPYIIFGFISLNTPKVFITIPKGSHFESVRIKTAAGSIAGKDLNISTSKSNFSIDAGSIQLSGITSAMTKIGCNAGKIELSGTFSGQTKIECNAGSIDLHTTGNMDEWSYAGESNLGSIRINNNNISGIGKHQSDSQKQNHFDIKCNMGSVEISMK